MQGWPASHRPRATFPTVLLQRATSYTWANMNITPSLPNSHTHLCSDRFITNITHQHDNDRTLQAINCYAWYLVGLLGNYWAARNRAKSRMRLVCRGLATPNNGRGFRQPFSDWASRSSGVSPNNYYYPDDPYLVFFKFFAKHTFSGCWKFMQFFCFLRIIIFKFMQLMFFRCHKLRFVNGRARASWNRSVT